MPTIVRKTHSTMIETRRENFHAVSWQVHSSGWSPPTDVYETEDNFVVRVEVAGLRDDDIEVAIENNVLMISGSRADLNERRAYRQMEIRFGKFEIAVEIPVQIEVEKSAAQYKDGFLVIRLPKLNSKNAEVE
jgi:HSP20 family protein